MREPRSSTWWVGIAVTLFLVAYVLVPIGVVVWVAFSSSELLGVSSEQWVATVGGWKGFSYVWGIYSGHLWRSIWMGVLVSLGATLLGAATGYGLSQGKSWWRRIVEALLLLPLSIPGIVVAVALIVSYSHTPSLRTGPYLLLAAHLLYTIPLTTRVILGAIEGSGLFTLIETAATLGASSWFRVHRVVFPSLKRALIASLSISFAVSWGEFNVSFLLTTPLQATFPSALYQTYTSNSLQVAASATVIFLLGLLPPLLLLQLIGGRASQAA
jgi:putative spermidine/putrescine transport system permease protein